MIEIGYLAACQTFYHKIVANVSIYNRRKRTNDRLEKEHFIGAYFLLAAGLLIAGVTFAVEIVWNIWTTSTITTKAKRRTAQKLKQQRKQRIQIKIPHRRMKTLAVKRP